MTTKAWYRYHIKARKASIKKLSKELIGLHKNIAELEMGLKNCKK